MKQQGDKAGSGHKRCREVRYQLWGWILFIICALFFIAAGIINRDLSTIAGSIIFLIACVFFIIPLSAKSNEDR